MPPSFRPLLLLAFAAALPFPCPAQLPAPKLSWVFPPGAAAGSSADVACAGSDLDQPADLHFSDPRISATRLDQPPATFRVHIPEDVPPGWVDVRFVGAFGVSNPRTFAIGPARTPEIIAPDTPGHTSAASALPVDLDVTINGRAVASAHTWFRFETRQPRRLLAMVQTREIDSRLVPDLALFDSDLRELRVARRAEVLDANLPSAGTWFLRLNDQTYRGGHDHAFRLTLSTRPRIEFALPLALTSSTNVSPRITVFGRNLPDGTGTALFDASGSPLESLEIHLDTPPRPACDLPPWPARRPAGAIAFLEPHAIWHPAFRELTLPPVPLALTPFPVCWSIGDGLTEVTPPCDFSGVFPRRGQTHGVTFKAVKDTVLWIEIFSDRLGFNTDPHLVVQKVRTTDAGPGSGPEQVQDIAEFADLETNLGGREFDTLSRDAAGRFQVPEDATYRILARDLLRGGSTSPRLPYRLQIRPESPDFALAVHPQPPPRRDDNDRQIHLATPTIRPGGTLPLRVVALRRDGFTGPIDLHVQGLPQGVAASPARIPAGQNATVLILGASINAHPGPASLLVQGRASIAGHEIVRTAAASTLRWHVQDWDQERAQPRFTPSLVMAVTTAEPAPVSLEPDTTTPIETVAKGKLRLPITVVRRTGFASAFKLKPFGHPALDKAPEIEVPENAGHVDVELDLNTAALPEGEHYIHFEATVAGKYTPRLQAAGAASEPPKPRDVSIRVHSPPVTVRVIPPPPPAPSNAG